MTKKLLHSKATFTHSERERQSLAERGEAVVASMRHDHALIAWAKATGVYVRIDRRSIWGNPFEIGKDGDRTEVIEKYREHIRQEADLIERITELRGRVLGCWCHPEPCHGGVLIELLNETPHEYDACRGLRSARSNCA